MVYFRHKQRRWVDERQVRSELMLDRPLVLSLDHGNLDTSR